MLIKDDYWIQAYEDTTRNDFLVLFTYEYISSGTLKIIDSIALKDLKDDEWIDYGTVKNKGKEDPEIVVKIRTKSKENINEIIQAWRANMKTLRFEEITIIDLEIEEY